VTESPRGSSSGGALGGDRVQALEREIAHLSKMVRALMDRAEAAASMRTYRYGVLRSTILLQEEVRRRTDELAAALRENEQITSNLRESEARSHGLVNRSIAGKMLAYCTTNGTRALQIAKGASGIAIGAFIMLGYIEKAAHRHRLKTLGLDDVIPYSFSCDLVKVVPVFDGRVIKGEGSP
jgi:phosphosulfolactate phosphohydrolase-like enzyme